MMMRGEERGEQMEEIRRDSWAAEGEWEGKTGGQRCGGERGVEREGGRMELLLFLCSHVYFCFVLLCGGYKGGKIAK
jgi:hypothetical protein